MENAPKMVRGIVQVVTFGRPKTVRKRIRDASSTFHRFWSDFGRHFGDILKVLAPKIKHLAPQGRTKTLQKRIRNVTLIFHGFYIDFGSHVGDILKVLAASSSQYRLVSCFQMVRFNGQYLKVSAVAPQLQSADTGRCQAFQTNEASMPQAPPSEACPPYLPASTGGIEMALKIALFSSIFGVKF